MLVLYIFALGFEKFFNHSLDNLVANRNKLSLLCHSSPILQSTEKQFALRLRLFQSKTLDLYRAAFNSLQDVLAVKASETSLFQMVSITVITVKLLLNYNPLSANFTEWTNCLSVFDHFVGLALKGLKKYPL